MPHFAAFFLIALPWLNPFAPGPSPAVVPLLFSWACAAALFGSYWRAPDPTSNSRLVSTTAYAWLAAGLLSCLMGLFQYLGGEGSLLPWVNQAELGQGFANLRQRNQFASLTNMALAALVWFAASRRIATAKHLLPVLLAAGLLAIGNAASSSRTGLVQLVLLCVLVGLWGRRVSHWRQVWQVLATAVAVYALAIVLLPWLAGLDPALHGLTARLRAGDEACGSRLTLWSNVLHLIVQKPWLGWGWGELDYAHYVTAYNGPRFCDILDNAHNLPLHLAVELGVPAAITVCGVFMVWVLHQRPWREADPARQLAWSVVAVILLHSMLEYPLWYGPFQMAFGLCLLMLWRTREPRVELPEEAKNSSNRFWSPVLRTLVAIILIATIAYAAWDYHRISQIYLAPEQRTAAYRDDTLEKIQHSWLFADQARFAELVLTPLTRDNARLTFNTATALLHYSPEPRIIEKTIESAVLLGLDDEALAQLARYRAAFPQDYARWTQENAKLPMNLLPLK